MANKRKARQNQRDFYKKTQQNANAPRNDVNQPVKKKAQNGPQPTWYYLAPTWGVSVGGYFALIILIQFFAVAMHNLGLHGAKDGFFTNVGDLWKIYLLLLFAIPIAYAIAYKKFHAIWFNNNAMYLTEDIQEYTNDSYVRTIDHLTQELDVAPDVGLGFDGHVSTLMGHMMVSNKGIKKIDVPVYDPNVDGFVKRDENGDIVTKKMPMFNESLADTLFQMSGVPQEYRISYDATDYDFNRKLTRKEGGDGKKRAGSYGRKEYDKLSDYINGEFYTLDTETERPAGVYFYDSRPVNTILIAITRGGKGQTYIEPAFDVWTREKKKWNIFTTDPKGELLAKFYYSATVRGMDVVQFNLMNPNLTNVFNPLANAIQEFRRDNINKGTALIDSIVDTLFPENGEIWNPAAGNMFRRAVYLLFDYFIEQEKYIRYVGYRDHVPQEVIDQEIDTLYSKVTMYNVYDLIGDLAAKVSKDVDFINIDENAPKVAEKDLLTLVFDAMAMLPTNSLRSLAITANNAIKQIAGAQQTIAGIYATLLTGLSAYADPTTIALMSGSLSESFDVTGLGFPRRFGIQFDEAYVKKFRITGELGKWTVYRDKDFTDQYEGDAYTHEERIASSNWIWGHFAGIFDQEETYVKLTIESNGTIAKEFFFKFVKGYKTFDNITYVINPITKDKIISGGVLIELDPETKEPKVSEFRSQQINYVTQSYQSMNTPIITSNQVFYSERPKFIFAITPPHLQQYQKHILIIIKQIIDEIYANSYVTKSTRKPIIGTRLMLEEFGNIRSGENGIPNIDTITSIALGQDVQITFVLQSFQQLRSVYGEDIEKIIRANSSNTIFLKSNDEELVNELVRLSGTKHEFRVKSKSVSRKMGDVVTISEPIINYSGEHVETTALTANDLLFLAGPSPGNSITFSSGEMPIVNKLETITPMAAGLHKHLPQPVTGQYSDSTMPSTSSNDGFNFLDNVIDGEGLVNARVQQAKIAKEVKATILEIAEKNNITINERDGELANIMMNIVYEKYDSDSGQTRQTLAEPVKYHEVAKRMWDNVLIIKDANAAKDAKLSASNSLREDLVRLAMDKDLADLTSLYKDKPSSDIPIGYDPISVSSFIAKFKAKYPAPERIKVENVDVFDNAKKIANYQEYDDGNSLPFDPYNIHYTDALEEVILGLIDGEYDDITGVDVDVIDDKGVESYKISVGGTPIAFFRAVGDEYDVQYMVKPPVLAKLVAENSMLLNYIQSLLNDNY